MRRLLLLVPLPFLLDAVVAYLVFFDWDQAALSPHARATLAKAGQTVASGRPVRIRLAGEDDHDVGPTYVAALDQARLRGMTIELRRNGVSQDRIVQAGPRTVLLQPDRTARVVQETAAAQ